MYAILKTMNKNSGEHLFLWGKGEVNEQLVFAEKSRCVKPKNWLYYQIDCFHIGKFGVEVDALSPLAGGSRREVRYISESKPLLLKNPNSRCVLQQKKRPTKIIAVSIRVVA